MSLTFQKSKIVFYGTKKCILVSDNAIVGSEAHTYFHIKDKTQFKKNHMNKFVVCSKGHRAFKYYNSYVCKICKNIISDGGELSNEEWNGIMKKLDDEEKRREENIKFDKELNK